MESAVQLTFPLSFAMKIIMRAESQAGENRAMLASAFEGLAVRHENWSEKASGAGRYVSYSVLVTAENREEFLLVHEKIAKVPGVRYVL